MKQRFPDMGQASIDQGDPCFVFFAQFVAKAGGKLKTASATANNDDMVRVIHNNQTFK